MRAIGERARARLAPLREDPRVREVRGVGSLAAVELAQGGGYLAGIALELRRAALARGILLRPLGPVLYLLPPACTTDDEVDFLADALLEIVRSLPEGSP